MGCVNKVICRDFKISEIFKDKNEELNLNLK